MGETYKVELHLQKVSTGEIRIRAIDVNADQLQNINNQIGRQIGDYLLLKVYECLKVNNN